MKEQELGLVEVMISRRGFPLKNTVATSTASVERVFSGMNRICSKLRVKMMPERLGDLICISMNRDLTFTLDIDRLIDVWSEKLSRRVGVKV